MSCADVCAGVGPYETATNCAPNPNCEQDCITALAQFNCDPEYFTVIECLFTTPTSSWDCDPVNGLVFMGPECSNELDAFFLCVNP